MQTYKKYPVDVLKGKICPYCGNASELIDSAEVYNGVSYGWMYICRSCNAYVGCYKNSKEPLGMLANAELRLTKMEAHHYFDQLWKKKIFKSRFTAYNWLSKHLDTPREFTHIGMSDIEQCRKIIQLSIDKFNRSNIEYDEFAINRKDVE